VHFSKYWVFQKKTAENVIYHTLQPWVTESQTQQLIFNSQRCHFRCRWCQWWCISTSGYLTKNYTGNQFIQILHWLIDNNLCRPFWCKECNSTATGWKFIVCKAFVFFFWTPCIYSSISECQEMQDRGFKCMLIVNICFKWQV